MTLHEKQNAKMRNFMPYLPMPDYFIDALELRIRGITHRTNHYLWEIFKYPDIPRILDEIETKYRYNLYDVSIDELNDPNGYWNWLYTPSRLNCGWAYWFISEATFSFDEKKYIWAMQCMNEATLHIGQAQAHWEIESKKSEQARQKVKIRHELSNIAKFEAIEFYETNNTGVLFEKDNVPKAVNYMKEHPEKWHTRNRKIAPYTEGAIQKWIYKHLNENGTPSRNRVKIRKL